MTTDHKTGHAHPKTSDNVKHAADGKTHAKALSDASATDGPDAPPEDDLHILMAHVRSLEADVAFLRQMFGWPEMPPTAPVLQSAEHTEETTAVPPTAPAPTTGDGATA